MFLVTSVPVALHRNILPKRLAQRRDAIVFIRVELPVHLHKREYLFALIIHNIVRRALSTRSLKRAFTSRPAIVSKIDRYNRARIHMHTFGIGLLISALEGLKGERETSSPDLSFPKT